MTKKLLFNGNIITMDAERKSAGNLLIEGEAICKVDLSAAEIEQLKDVEAVDLAGTTCIPGFHDSHMHLIEYGYNKKYCVDLSGAGSIEEVIKMMQSFIEERALPEGSWVMGMRWNQENFKEKRLLTRKDLDRISDKHYIFTKRVCIHIAAVNSKLLELCGVNRDTFREDENIGRYADGRPNGLIYEDAISGIILQKKPPLTVEEIEGIIADTTREIKGKGFSAVQSDDMKAFSDFQSKENIVRAYDNLRNRGELPIRVFEQVQVSSLEEFLQIQEFLKEVKDDELFSHNRLKLILDGSLGASTAAMETPYKGTTDHYGILNFRDEELNQLVEFAYMNNMQVMCHCIGERAINQAIRMIGRYQKRYGQDRRPRLVHCQICTKEQVEQMAQLQMMADIQPAFVPADYRAVYEKIEAAEQFALYPWKTMLDRGIRISSSSDAPVESYDALYGIQTATTRAAIDGSPQGGWLPTEKLSVEEALRLYTETPAYSVFMEEKIGKIKEGFKADLTILDQNPLETAPELIYLISAVKTFCNGRGE